MDPQILLQEISGISKKYELLYQKTGGYFNIFDIADISTDEVTICRVLYALLSPQGSHHQGVLFLKLFFETVLKMEVSESELKSAVVLREYTIDKNRRIDLLIKTSARTIPIEVKIYAGDQERQCFDYYQSAKESNVFYLTLNGEPPGLGSAKGLTKTEDGYAEVTCISFAEDILAWLRQCVAHSNIIRIAPIREILLQFMSLIRRLTNQLEDSEEMEIKELLMKSPENIRTANAIEQSLLEAKHELMHKVFESIEEKVGIPKIRNEYDYKINGKKVREFYNYKTTSTCPGISYLYKENAKPDVDVLVRIEIDSRIFIGYCTPLKGKVANRQLSDEKIREILGREPKTYSWWAYWEYLPTGEQSDAPNFKALNGPYFDLYNESKFEEFTTKCAEKVKKFLEQ